MLKIFALFLTWIATSCFAEMTLKINGSTTVNPVVVDAASVFTKKGWRVLVDTQGGSSGGISYLAEKLVDIGMCSRHVVEKDHKKFPDFTFKEHKIGYDGVALVVPKALYEQGITKLTRKQIQDLYSGEVRNWKELGGPDLKVVFFNKEPGRGTWEVFAEFTYGKADAAPKVFHPEVGSNQEGRTKVSNQPGGITQLSASWAWEHDKVKALAIVDDSGKIIEPSMENIATSTYPMRRPLLLVTGESPKNEVLEFIAWIKSADGQKLVKKHGYLPLQ
jgi:phosphate transport system substrate-binding protein